MILQHLLVHLFQPCTAQHARMRQHLHRSSDERGLRVAHAHTCLAQDAIAAVKPCETGGSFLAEQPIISDLQVLRTEPPKSLSESKFTTRSCQAARAYAQESADRAIVMSQANTPTHDAPDKAARRASALLWSHSRSMSWFNRSACASAFLASWRHGFRAHHVQGFATRY